MTNASSWTARFPATAQTGPFSVNVSDGLYESKEDMALWYYNSALAHDGLDPVEEMPDGVEFTPKETE